MKTEQTVELQKQGRRKFLIKVGASSFALTLADLVPTLRAENAPGVDCTNYESGDETCKKAGDSDEGCDPNSNQTSADPDQGCTSGDPANKIAANRDEQCIADNPNLAYVNDASCGAKLGWTDAACNPPNDPDDHIIT